MRCDEFSHQQGGMNRGDTTLEEHRAKRKILIIRQDIQNHLWSSTIAIYSADR